MTILLFIAAFGLLAYAMADKDEIRKARAEANRKYAWLYIPTALIWALLIFG